MIPEFCGVRTAIHPNRFSGRASAVTFILRETVNFRKRF
jgi:hypothetical protein